VNINLRAVDSLFLVRRPVALSYSAIASAFIGTGILLIFVEALFFDYFSGLANSSFTTRRIIGFHLFPSELWFIFLGNFMLFLMLGNRGFVVPRYLFVNSRPIFLVLGVYSLWFVYGSLAGNSWALQEFREVVFTALSLPPILYFASYMNVGIALRRTVLPGMVLLLAMSIFNLHNSALMIGTFFASFWALRLLFSNPLAIVGLGFASLPFLIKFSKPTIVMFAFCIMVSFLLAGHLNRNSVNWIFSKFKLKIVLVGLSILLALLALVAVINAWTGGAIEEIIRWYFLKERLTASGETIYADVSGGRFAIWRAAIESWVERPILGYGLGAEVQAYSSGWVNKVQFHSYLIQGLHNTGLLGLATIVGGWSIWLLRTLRRVALVSDVHDKILLAAMLAYVFGIFFFGLYGHSLSYPPSAQLFWLCVGALCAVRAPRQYRVSA